MDPDGATPGDAVVAQITVPAEASGVAQMSMQGRSLTGEDWQAHQLVFEYPSPPWHPTAESSCVPRASPYGFEWVELSDRSSVQAVHTAHWVSNPSEECQRCHPSDDGWFDVVLPWTFTWYGVEERVISIGTNGLITFGTEHYMYGGTEPVPCRGEEHCGNSNGVGVDGLIAVFWTDLNPGQGGTVYYAVEHPHTMEQAMVVQWKDVVYWSSDQAASTAGDDASVSFEVILYPSGDVIMQYQHVHQTNIWSEVSIGWEDQTGTRGYQILYDQWPQERSAYRIPWCAHSGDAVAAPIVPMSITGWSTYGTGGYVGHVRFWPYYDSKCTGTVQAVVCVSGAPCSGPAEMQIPTHSSQTLEQCRGDALCECAQTCLHQRCDAFSTRHNDSACTLYQGAAGHDCKDRHSTHLRTDRFYDSDVWVFMPAGSHSPAMSTAARPSRDRPWTGQEIRDAEYVIIPLLVLVMAGLIARTLAPVRGRSLSGSIDAYFAARHDTRVPRPDERMVMERGASRSPARELARELAGNAQGSPAEREPPAPPRPPTFVFGMQSQRGGGGGGGGGGMSAGEAQTSASTSLSDGGGGTGPQVDRWPAGGTQPISSSDNPLAVDSL